MPKDTTPTIPYYSVPQLKKRGWTTRMIARFLDPPDELKPNPHYRKAAPMRRYLQSRVETTEAEPAFKKRRKLWERCQVYRFQTMSD